MNTSGLVVCKVASMSLGSGVNPARTFDRMRWFGGATLAIGAVLSALLGTFPLAIGLVLGGLVVLGWIGGSFSRGLAQPVNNRAKALVADRGTYIVRTIVATLPCFIVGLVTLLIGVEYPVAQVPAGVFLAMAFSFLLIYLAIWSVARSPE